VGVDDGGQIPEIAQGQCMVTEAMPWSTTRCSFSDSFGQKNTDSAPT
jgi:hypothetical protein